MTDSMMFSLMGLTVALGGLVLERIAPDGSWGELCARLMYSAGALSCGVGIGMVL